MQTENTNAVVAQAYTQSLPSFGRSSESQQHIRLRADPTNRAKVIIF
jgi:hypothetical protein